MFFLISVLNSSTFQNIQGNTDKIWKYQRYHLVLEHFDAPVIPPPFNIFGYVLEFIIKKFFNKKQNESHRQSICHFECKPVF